MEPKLRFKEFNGDWEEKRLGDIAKIYKGNTLSKSDLSDEGEPCILYGELYTKYGEIINKVYSKTNRKDKNLFLGKNNDVLIPSSGETAIDISTASCLKCDDIYIGGDLNVIRSSNVIGDFLSYALNHKQRNAIAKFAQGVSIVHLYGDSLKKLKLKLPLLPEQTKIADFLSTVDEKIQNQQDKITHLENIKKGFIQKIFSRKIRFKDANGNEFPEWEEKKLGDIVTFINGKAHEKNVTEEGKYIIVNSKFISTDGKTKKYSNEIMCPLKKNDIVMVMSDVPNGKAMSKCFLINKDNKYTLNQRICALRTNNEPRFILYQVNRNKYFMKFDDGIKQTNLRKEDVLNCPIFVANIEEQQKIADFLSSFDEKIDAEKETLEHLKELKKGLLQQMFV